MGRCRLFRWTHTIRTFFLCLTFAAGTLSHSHHESTRRCVHSSHVEKETERMQRSFYGIPLETHRSVNDYFRPQGKETISDNGESGPLRIHVEYQLSGLPIAKQNFIKNNLVPAMRGVFLRALNVRKRVKGRFLIPRKCISTFKGFPGYCHKFSTTCGTALHNKALFGPARTCIQPYDDQCIKIPSGEGVENADFVLYFTAKQDRGCAGHSETVASAGFCTHDYDNWYGLPNRPLAGVANFCPNSLYTEDDKFGYMLDTAVHEVLHALVMNKNLFEMFIDRQGRPIRTAIVRGAGSLEVRTPTVKKVVREMFGCPTMEGAKLEDEGGYGTAESHWERRLFMGEIMVGSSSTSARVVLSNITLALLEDSGWYDAKYIESGVLSAVEHRGCGFVNTNCRYPNKVLEDTFCWNNKPASSQSAVCTPDHMAVGYCKNDISLIGDCSIVQPFKNTHCTNRAHQVDTEHVDLGIRHRPGSRCFPVSSFKIERTENYYTVFRSDLGAACFISVCKGRELYIRIPATKEFREKDIRCPTGQKVDLSKQGLGFQEGIVGPCPNNRFVCESWGDRCPEDCSGYGTCLEGKCYCDLGYVGKTCSVFACPHRACKSTEYCNVENGLCIPRRRIAPPVRLPAPKIVPSPSPKPQPKKASAEGFGLVPIPGARKPRLSQSPKPQPKKASAEGFGLVPIPGARKPRLSPSPKPQPKKASAEGFGLVPLPAAKKPKPMTEEEIFGEAVKKVPRRARSPDPGSFSPKQPSPLRPTPSTAAVPAYGSPTLVKISGRAIGVGFLRKCVIFEDEDGDLRIDRRTRKEVTGKEGQWSFDTFKQKDEMIVDPGIGGRCVDAFTNLRPLWRLRGFETVKTLSAISTLAALAPGARKMESQTYWRLPQRHLTNIEENRSRRKKDPYALEQTILKGIGLKDKYILQRDFITETYETKDKEAKRAVVYNAIILNTVLQIACFSDASGSPSFRNTDFMFRVLGHFLQGGVTLDKMVYSDTVYLLVDEFTSDFSTNSRSGWLLSESIARTNKMITDQLSRSSGLQLLEGIARLMVVLQTKLCPLAAELKSSTISWSEYSRRTEKYVLTDLVRQTKIPDIASAVTGNEPTSPAATIA